MPDVAFKDLVHRRDRRRGPTRSGRRVLERGARPAVVKVHDDGGFSLGSARWRLEEPRRVDQRRCRADRRARAACTSTCAIADGDPAPLLAAGGTLERTRRTTTSTWHIVNDPDGVAVCVFGPHPADPSVLGPFELVVDAVDPPAIAGWWAERTGGTVGSREGAPFVWIEGAAGFPYMFWVFHDVPEPKTVKNRVHWDVTLVDTTIEGLVAAGATLLRPKDDEISWWVMADPEGNEFCAFE